MILLFLGSWRSTVIVCTSIPLSILTSCIVLWCCGYTINVMTLGGMALAVGILVDDATVEIENVHRNMGMAKPLTRGHSRWRPADRAPVLRLHSRHLHRLRSGSAAYRIREVSVYSACAGCGVCHADVLLPDPYAGPDHGPLHVAPGSGNLRQRRGGSRERDWPLLENAPRVQQEVRKDAGQVPNALRLVLAPSRASHRDLRSFCRRFSFPGPRDRHGLLSVRRLRPDPVACARPGRHPHRGNRTRFRRSGANHS